MRALLFVVLASCAGENDEGAETCTVAVDDGVIEASVDGDAWSADATWTEAGEGVQVVTTTSGGWRLTIAAQQALAAIEVGDLPVTVDLAGDSGFVTAYPESGDASFSSSAGAGSLSFIAMDDGLLSGCFTADTVSADGDVLTLSGGEFVAEGL